MVDDAVVIGRMIIMMMLRVDSSMMMMSLNLAEPYFQQYWRSWPGISDKLLFLTDLSNEFVSYGFVQKISFTWICSINRFHICPKIHIHSLAFPKINFLGFIQ